MNSRSLARFLGLLAVALIGCKDTSAPIMSSHHFVSLAAGGGSTCGLTDAGAAYCWGFGQDGQLGNGSYAAVDSLPTPVQDNQTWSEVILGDNFGCGLRPSRQADCWGWVGITGDTLATRNNSVPVPIVTSLHWISLAGVAAKACAIEASGSGYCWGDNPDGVGLPQTFQPTPLRGGLQWALITVGGTHTCGITLAGDAYCWGSNANGEIGRGVFGGYDSAPAPVNSGHRFVSLTAGGLYTCGLTGDSAAYCWGTGLEGRLGTGSTSDDSVPTPVVGGHRFAQLLAGAHHACGLTGAGIAYCWGGNIYGELGITTTADDSVPNAVAGGLIFTSLSLGSDHTCGLTNEGSTYCWGNNNKGQLGNGSTVNSNIPVKAATPQ
jgi:alpha-tubulin suppressor-like RCC1 family protein